jgi:hypothetical protein
VSGHVDFQFDHSLEGVHFYLVDSASKEVLASVKVEPENAREAAFFLSKHSIACEELRKKNIGGGSGM